MDPKMVDLSVVVSDAGRVQIRSRTLVAELMNDLAAKWIAIISSHIMAAIRENSTESARATVTDAAATHHRLGSNSSNLPTRNGARYTVTGDAVPVDGVVKVLSPFSTVILVRESAWQRRWECCHHSHSVPTREFSSKTGEHWK